MLRPYTLPERPTCLKLFDSNLPRFFAEHERAEFAAFLDKVDKVEAGSEAYFVLERGAEVVACGGVGQDGGETFLTWGMVRGDLHGTGLGDELTRSRLDWLRRHWPAVTHAKIETSQHTEGFYARFGFEATERTPDGFGPELDKVTMVAKL